MPSRHTFDERVGSIVGRLDAESTSGCWNWTGPLSKDGYGVVTPSWGATRAHRALFLLLYGPLPSKVCVLHKCDNRKCCNPFHLFTGTQADNIKDAVKKGRQPRAVGERQGSSILTEEIVIKMRAIKKDTNRTGLDIAKEFGVSECTALQAINGHSWSHLPGAVKHKRGRN